MPDELLPIAVEAARAGGEVLLRSFRSGDFETREKTRHDLVTSVDRESEAVIRRVLRGAFPRHTILAEEAGETEGAGDELWIVDPLDGTTNFVRGLPCFAVSVAHRRHGELVAAVVLDPCRDEIYVAERGAGARRDERPLTMADGDPEEAVLATGFPFRARPALDLYLECFRRAFLACRAIRRCGSAALDLAWTAAGVFDGFFEFRLSAWDVAAGALLIREAGGVVTDLDGGERFLETGNVLAGAPRVHAELRRLFRDLATEEQLQELVPHPQLEGVS